MLKLSVTPSTKASRCASPLVEGSSFLDCRGSATLLGSAANWNPGRFDGQISVGRPRYRYVARGSAVHARYEKGDIPWHKQLLAIRFNCTTPAN